jgi:hypothetical protein
MSTMSKDLSNRLREVLINGQWIAHTNFKAQITSVTWEQATQKIGNLNTIAILTFHVCYYLKGLQNVFEGGTLDIKDKFSFDMPDINSEADWNALVIEFLITAEKFISYVDSMDETMLNGPFVKEEYGTYLRNIEAQIEHSYYHLGQISLIKKLLQA